jgi:hypothetical protein
MWQSVTRGRTRLPRVPGPEGRCSAAELAARPGNHKDYSGSTTAHKVLLCTHQRRRPATPRRREERPSRFPPLRRVVPCLHLAGSRWLRELLLQPPQLSPCLRSVERQLGKPAQQEAVEPRQRDFLDDASAGPELRAGRGRRARRTCRNPCSRPAGSWRVTWPDPAKHRTTRAVAVPSVAHDR